MRSETKTESQCQIGIDTTTSNNGSSGGSCGIKGAILNVNTSRADSPLDFSKKNIITGSKVSGGGSSKPKKFKSEPLTLQQQSGLGIGAGTIEGIIKGLNNNKKKERSKSVTSSAEEEESSSPESPCSRLRNILSMKSPLVSEDMAGTVLNLSKESPLLSSIWCKSESQLSTGSNGGGSSNSNSPPLSGLHHQRHSLSHSTAATAATMFLQSNSPRPATIPLTMIGGGGTTPTLVIPGLGDLGSLTGGGSAGEGGLGSGPSSGNSSSSSNGGSDANNPLGLPANAWGSGTIYSPSISPILNQTVPTSVGGAGLPLSFETSPTLFPHHHAVIAAGATSPMLPFPPGLSLPIPAVTTASNGVGPAGSKARTTRPFKAYPKDPLSFSSVGLYGLPLGTAPGTTEAVIHQQSNQAYAEFRKQMLSSSQFGKARRGAHHRNNVSPYPSPLDSLVDDHPHHLHNAGILSPDVGGPLSLLRDGNPNDSGSASDDGNSLLNGKNRSGKSEQQLKDEAYWERRRKNNEAAKRSRDARRAKEDEIAIRAAFLEQENLKLRFEVCALKNETAKLRCMLYSS